MKVRESSWETGQTVALCLLSSEEGLEVCWCAEDVVVESSVLEVIQVSVWIGPTNNPLKIPCRMMNYIA